eukprot:TRINITY_DN8100_c0_g1_i1.p1 TRINITY_DN8100_c0_g1~~TRINITY_DN8100_c0_g1_i1.p1  ORF type:complete len:877 (-),score=144.30 TRINITY_DN8100_c0_g1_i1:80-2710(-)
MTLGSFRWAIPQNSSDLSLTPIASKVCNWCTLVCTIMSVWVHMFYEYADVTSDGFDEDASVQWFLQFTAIMSVAGFLYELGFATTLVQMGLDTVFQDDLTFRRRLRLNKKLLFVFACLAATYILMSTGNHVMHKGWLAEYYGAHQVVNSFRFIDWTICSPIIMSTAGQLDHAPDGSPRNALIQSSVLVGVCCGIAGQALIVKDVFAAWALLFMAYLSFLAVNVEQLTFACYIKDAGSSGKLRSGLIFSLVFMMWVYGIFYLLPFWGLFSAGFEIKFYCCGDVAFKILTSMIMMTSEDLAAAGEIRVRTHTLAHDLQSLIQTAAVPIISINDKGQVVDWNMKAAKLTGLPSDLAMGKNLISMLGTGRDADADDLIRRALLGEAGGTLQTILNPLQLEGLDHNNLHLNKASLVLSATPRRFRAGHGRGVTLVGYDLTEVAAYREAEKRKVNFMAIVSHELRSPLHGIIGLTEHLCGEEKDPGKLRMLTLVANCANRLLDLVVNIMEMVSMVSVTADSKTKPVKQLSRDPVKLGKIIDEIVVLVSRSTDKNRQSLVKKGVELVSLVKDLPIIEADAHKCSQVFYNIITNACKFTLKGSIVVSSLRDPEGNWVEISVKDTGKGIAQGSLERIFMPFEQEDNSMIRGYQGVGLGLSIAHEVVRRHGGFIEVESEVDVGTTFTVRLPVVAADCTADLVEQPVPEKVPNYEREDSSAGPSSQELDSRPKVFSVDDCPTNQEVIQNMFGSTFDVNVAMSGEEAINYLQNCDKLPDVMLLDVMMPVMSGFEVCRYVREKMHIPSTRLPILMLSAATQSASIIEGFECGANDYISKPCDKHMVIARVHAALRIKNQHQRELDRAAGRATHSPPDDGTNGCLQPRRA